MHKKKISFNTISLITVIHYVIYCESWNSDLISGNKNKVFDAMTSLHH